MTREMLAAATKGLVDQLVLRKYDELVRGCFRSRLTAGDIQRAIEEYGCTISCPPESAYDAMDVVRILHSSPPAWSVWMPLWTEEEGRSDLTLGLTISWDASGPMVELDELHVL